MEATYVKPGLCCSRRLELAVLVFFGVMLMYSFRVNMSVAMVCMTTTDADPLNTAGFEGNVSSRNLTNDAIKTYPYFNWDKQTQGVILGSFFWAYATFAILGGWLAQKVGGKQLLGMSVLLCSVFTLLTPIAADTHVIFLIVVRALSGLAQGAMWPAQQMVWAQWAPPLERTILSGFTISGMGLGNVVAFPVSGLLCQYGPGYGWSSIFYVFGGAGIVWCVVWLMLVSDTPDQHPRISTEERRYIVQSLQNETHASSKALPTFKSKRTPWMKILKSPPVWAFGIVIMCADWGLYTFVTNIPAYLTEIFNYNIVQGGLLSAMPFLGFAMMTLISTHAADGFRSKGYLSTTKVRKIANILGTFLPATLLLITSQVEDNPGVSVSTLTIGLTMTGFVFGGVASSNALDIASRYAGIIMGIAISLSSISGTVAPIIIGIITTDKSHEQWKRVFYITSAIQVFGGVVYLVFGSGEHQEWANGDAKSIQGIVATSQDKDVRINHCKANEPISSEESSNKY